MSKGTLLELIRCVDDDVLPPLSVVADYFGKECGSDEDITTIFGLYQGLIKYRGVSADEVFNAYLSGSLDNLMDKYYTNRQTQYYKTYKDQGIKIGITYQGGLKSIQHATEDVDEYKDIDDVCPNCGHDGYRIWRSRLGLIPPDCYNGCGRFICGNCSNPTDETEEDFICRECLRH